MKTLHLFVAVSTAIVAGLNFAQGDAFMGVLFALASLLNCVGFALRVHRDGDGTRNG